MLEQGQPDFTQELADNDESEVRKAKKPKAHAPLPFTKGGESHESSQTTLDREVPLIERLEHVIDLHSGKTKTQELPQEVNIQVPHLEEVYEAPPMPPAIDESIYDTDDLPERHHIEHSVWHSYEVDEHGQAVNEAESVLPYGEEFHHEQRQEKPTELDYEDVDLNNTEPKDEEDEVAAASGQLAVSTVTNDEDIGQTQRLGGSDYGSIITAISERLAEMVQNAGQTISSFTAFDVILWAILFLIIISIIFAIHS